MKALSVEIYKSVGGDCSNGGISSRFNSILLLCDSGYIDVEGDEENLCQIVSRDVFGKTYTYIEPVMRPNGVGWMYGGTLCSSSDSRFKYDCLKLHDRCESQELYNLLNR